MERNKVKTSTEFWFLFLVLSGYLFVSAMAIPLGMEEQSRYFAVPFRVLIFLYSLFIIYKNFSSQFWRTPPVIALLLFWLLYAAKAVLSYFHDEYQMNVLNSWNEIYVRILIIVVVPSLALMSIPYHKIDLAKLGKYVFYAFLAVLSANLLYGFLNAEETLKWPAIFAVYYISYGHLGTSLAVLSLFFLLFGNPSKTEKWIFFLGLAVGCFTVFIATARSPFLALAVVSLFLLLVKKNIRFILIYFLILTTAVVATWWYTESGYTEVRFLTRTYAWLFEGDNSLRTPLFEKSIELFKSSPFFGARILYENGMYPHNLFLELLMATGVLGFILYFLKFSPVIKNIRLFTKPQDHVYRILFFALFLQYFVLVFTSYNLYSVPEFVHLSAIIIGISLNFTHEKT